MFVCALRESGRDRPLDFIISRARVSVSTKNQFEGNLALQRVNSLRKKGTSKLRALWAANTTYPPGFCRLLTNYSKIGIRSSILHLIHKTNVNLIVSKSELYWAIICKIWALISLMILNNLSKWTSSFPTLISNTLQPRNTACPQGISHHT